jgi:hypothetical protein
MDAELNAHRRCSASDQDECLPVAMLSSVLGVGRTPLLNRVLDHRRDSF